MPDARFLPPPDGTTWIDRARHAGYIGPTHEIFSPNLNQSIVPRVSPGTFRDAPGVSRRRLLVLVAALPIVGSTKVRAAGTWPEHTVRIIVPFAAGGPADLYARYLASRLQEAFGQTFLIDTGRARGR